MNQGKTVFAQLLQSVPVSHFEHLVDVYQGGASCGLPGYRPHPYADAAGARAGATAACR